MVYDSRARVGIALALGRSTRTASSARRSRAAERLRYPSAIASRSRRSSRRADSTAPRSVAGRAPREWERQRARWPRPRRGSPLARGSVPRPRSRCSTASVAEAHGDRPRALGAPRAAAAAPRRSRRPASRARARDVLQELATRRRAAGAHSVARGGGTRAAARARRVAAAGADASGRRPSSLPLGERLVTALFADVRGYTGLAAATAPAANAESIATLHRLAVDRGRPPPRHRRQVRRRRRDGDVQRDRRPLDHTELAAEAALALRDKAALLDIPIGIGIAVGPAVVGRAVAGDERQRARLDDEPRRAAPGRGGRGRDRARRGGPPPARGLARRARPRRRSQDLLELKGFAEPQPAYRLAAPR